MTDADALRPGVTAVTAIVAAYNEAPRIGAVLDVLTSYDGFAEVVVVDDGSDDGTADVAERHGATTLRVTPNRGKGHAMDVGVQHATTPVVFFADADIRGLTHEMIDATVRPIVEHECEMFILMRNRKIYLLHRIMAFVPLLGGERALTTDLWDRLPARYKDRFRIEAGLNFYAIHHGAGLRFRVFPGITQTVKEAKFGPVEGFRRRLRMGREVLSAAWDLQWNDLPKTERDQRVGAATAGLSTLGMLVGLLLVAGGIAGPVSFFSALFAGELAEDPGAPVLRFLLALVSGTTASVVIASGAAVLGLNAAFFLRGMLRLLTAGRVREQS